MAHFIVVGRPNDGAKGLGSVTAFNMERVHDLFMEVGDSTLSVTVADVMEPDEIPEDMLVARYLICHESTVLIEMLSMVACMEVKPEKEVVP